MPVLFPVSTGAFEFSADDGLSKNHDREINIINYNYLVRFYMINVNVKG